jgi:hypothetical protein
MRDISKPKIRRGQPWILYRREWIKYGDLLSNTKCNLACFALLSGSRLKEEADTIFDIAWQVRHQHLQFINSYKNSVE